MDVQILNRKVTIRIDDSRFEELLDCSRREGFSVSTIVRHLVYRYVEDQRRHNPKRLIPTEPETEQRPFLESMGIHVSRRQDRLAGRQQ